jgi:hypothetical protein
MIFDVIFLAAVQSMDGSRPPRKKVTALATELIHQLLEVSFSTAQRNS